MENEQTDAGAEHVTRDQIFRRKRGQGCIQIPCSADHKQDGQLYPVDPYSAIICDGKKNTLTVVLDLYTRYCTMLVYSTHSTNGLQPLVTDSIVASLPQRQKSHVNLTQQVTNDYTYYRTLLYVSFTIVGRQTYLAPTAVAAAVVVLASHIQRVACQPERLLYTVANSACRLLKRENRRERESLAAHPLTPTLLAGGEKQNKYNTRRAQQIEQK